MRDGCSLFWFPLPCLFLGLAWPAALSPSGWHLQNGTLVLPCPLASCWVLGNETCQQETKGLIEREMGCFYLLSPCCDNTSLSVSFPDSSCCQVHPSTSVPGSDSPLALNNMALEE